MSWLPPLPPWDGLHVLVVHFPIALLTVVPLFLLAGLLAPRLGRAWDGATLLLLTLGALGAVLAVETGEAAAAAATLTPAISAAVQHHAESGTLTRNVFGGLTLVWLAGGLVLPWLTRRLGAARVRLLRAVYLGGYVAALLLVANTADLGGRLVHHYGLHAHLAARR